MKRGVVVLAVAMLMVFAGLSYSIEIAASEEIVPEIYSVEYTDNEGIEERIETTVFENSLYVPLRNIIENWGIQLSG